jgi:long-chain acyl-CoA synthetase
VRNHLELLRGYGLTETSASATLMDLNDLSAGRVGAPLAGVQIKLIDWVEGGYRVTDKPNPRGEIVVGGMNITAGYYKNDSMTKECYINEDGLRWFYTGDIGEVSADGSFKIIDRKKDLVKLQFGEHVSLGKVEALLTSCPYVDNICVYGDSLQAYLIALVVPNAKALQTLAQQLSKQNLTTAQLCNDKEIISAITKAIQEHARKSKLHKMEIPAKIKLCGEKWSPDSGLLTAALKLRRKNIQEYYQTDINRMYGIDTNGIPNKI